MPVSPPAPRRPNHNKNGSPSALSRDDVVSGALALIDEGGMDALTMRALADRLNVYPATLYWHAGNRSQLLALICQRVLENVALPNSDLPWQAWVSEMASAVRGELGAHPNIAAYLTSQLQVNLIGLSFAEGSLTALAKAGFEGESLLRAYNTVTGTVFGWIAAEFAVDPKEADVEWRAHFEQQLNIAEDGAFPVLRQNLPVLLNRAFMLRWSSAAVMPMSSSFEFMVATLVAGLSAAAAELDARTNAER